MLPLFESKKKVSLKDKNTSLNYIKKALDGWSLKKEK